MHDCLIVGGGVIGLSLAYELAGEGLSVRVIDAAEPGKESSWAGAGIFPPANTRSRAPLDRLIALSNPLQRVWSQRFRQDFEIDDGYWDCGALWLARNEEAEKALATSVDEWRAGDIAIEALTPGALADLEPAVRPSQPLRAAYLMPGEFQIRNPWRIRALLAACAKRGVEVSPHTAAEDFVVSGGRVEGVKTPQGLLRAGAVCVCSGAWSGAIAGLLGPPPAIKPIRGQIVLLACPEPILNRIVYAGTQYLVPRGDGRVLVGSTLEDVGFDRGNTPRVVQELLAFALDMVPELSGAALERCWAGLRPATADGLPYMGPIPGVANAFIAAGHYRSGLQLSPGTAVVMSQLIRGKTPDLDLSSFRVGR